MSINVETYDVMNIDDAIKLLQSIKKKKGKNAKILITTINFDKNKSSHRITSPDEGCVLVRQSKTIVMNGDPYIPHMELYSEKQDVRHIRRKGEMHDIIFGG